MVWLLKIVLKLASAVKSLLANLSEYPGLRFLASPANKLGNVISSYHGYVAESQRAKMEIQVSRGKASSLAGIVAPAHKKAAADDASPPLAPAAGAAGAVSPPGGSASTQRSSPAVADPRGTLMIDAFMQSPEAPSDMRQRWLDAAAEREQQTGPEEAKPAYFGTLVPPDRARSAEPQPLGMTSPHAMEPLFSETIHLESPAHDTAAVIPAASAVHGPVRPEPPAARWMTPSRSEQPRESTNIDEGPVPEYSPAPSPAAMLDDDQPAMVPLAEREQQLAKLRHVCQWLREARQPLCPLNGALALLPLGTIEAGPREVVELQHAVNADLVAVQDELKLRFPVTALAVGLEGDCGFEELVRRVGPERAKSQRFGHRFDVRAAATPSQLTALCARISGVFEDWVYAIFRERGSIARVGNSHLFGLLCKVRTQLQDRLVRILCGGFGHDPEQAGAPGTPGRGEPVAFSGCYFAATGQTEDRRAFVEGIFDKLDEEQNKVEWTREALRQDRRLRRMGWLGLLAIAACGAALLVGHLMR